MQNIVTFIKGVSVLQSNTSQCGYWKHPISCRMKFRAYLNKLKAQRRDGKSKTWDTFNSADCSHFYGAVYSLYANTHRHSPVHVPKQPVIMSFLFLFPSILLFNTKSHMLIWKSRWRATYFPLHPSHAWQWWCSPVGNSSFSGLH